MLLSTWTSGKPLQTLHVQFENLENTQCNAEIKKNDQINICI